MQSSDAYLDAFMNGFEFVLLAIRGRIHLEDLTEEDRARLEAFVGEYAHIAEAYRKRRPAPTQGLGIEGRVRAEITAVASN